jgi:hypothetical protein
VVAINCAPYRVRSNGGKFQLRNIFSGNVETLFRFKTE